MIDDSLTRLISVQNQQQGVNKKILDYVRRWLIEPQYSWIIYELQSHW